MCHTLQVLEKFDDAALLELNLETGRTHQIGFIWQHIGHPLFGDPLYGLAGRDGMTRQAFMVLKLNFETPRRESQPESPASTGHDRMHPRPGGDGLWEERI